MHTQKLQIDNLTVLLINGKGHTPYETDDGKLYYIRVDALEVQVAERDPGKVEDAGASPAKGSNFEFYRDWVNK